MSAISKLRSYLRLSAENRAETGRSLGDTIKDLVPIVRHGLSPAEYYVGSLYDGIPPHYLSIREYARIERVLNPRQTGVVNFDKWHQYCFFKALDLATPEVFGFISGRRGMLGGGSRTRVTRTGCLPSWTRSTSRSSPSPMAAVMGMGSISLWGARPRRAR